jgi:hypothetical protein
MLPLPSPALFSALSPAGLPMVSGNRPTAAAVAEALSIRMELTALVQDLQGQRAATRLCLDRAHKTLVRLARMDVLLEGSDEQLCVAACGSHRQHHITWQAWLRDLTSLEATLEAGLGRRGDALASLLRGGLQALPPPSLVLFQ